MQRPARVKQEKSTEYGHPQSSLFYVGRDFDQYEGPRAALTGELAKRASY